MANKAATIHVEASTCEQVHEVPMCCEWSPSGSSDSRLFAVGLLDGTLYLQRADFIGVGRLRRPKVSTQWQRSHKRSVRGLAFYDSSTLFTICSNRGLVQWDVETSKKERCLRRCHDAPPYAMCSLPLDRGQMLATGDEKGIIRTWDMRMSDPKIAEYRLDGEDNGNYDVNVTSLGISHITRAIRLLATSDDGTLTVFDVRKQKKLMRSEMLECELLSVTCAADGTTYCGTGENMVEVFAHESWGNITRRLRPHHTKDATIDCIQCIPTATHLLLTASADDGAIRLHRGTASHSRSIACFGRHQEGVQAISASADGQWLLSTGVDNQVKLWPLAKTIEHYPATPYMQEPEHDSDVSSEDGESESDTSDDDSDASPAKKVRCDNPFYSGLLNAENESNENSSPNTTEESDE